MVRKLILLFTLMVLTNSPALSEQRLGSWTRLTSQLCYPAGGGCPVLVDSTIFYYEGLDWSTLTTPRPFEMSTILPSGELSSWKVIPDSDIGKGYQDVFTISAHGYLYAFGGWNYEMVDGFSTSVLRSKINPGKDQILGPWEKIQTWVESGGGAKLFYNNRVYVFSGRDSKEVKYYEIFSDGSVSTCSYSTTQINHKRQDSSAIMIDSCVFIIGGNTMNKAQIVERAVIYPDGEVGAFMDISTTMALHKRPGLVRVGNYLYVLGGVWGGNFEYRDEHALINPDLTLGPWQKGPYYPEPRIAGILKTEKGVYAIGGSIYGVNNDGPTTYVDFAPIIEGTDVEDKYWSELE